MNSSIPTGCLLIKMVKSKKLIYGPHGRYMRQFMKIKPRQILKKIKSKQPNK